jgi:hypothetical protein
MHQHITTRLTRIVDLVPLPPIIKGHHDASGNGISGICFPSTHITPCAGYTATQPVAWQFKWRQQSLLWHHHELQLGTCRRPPPTGSANLLPVVEDYVLHTAQTFLHVWSNDLHSNSAHTINFRVQRTLKAWKISNPAPLRVKPITITIIHCIAFLAKSPSC